MRVSFRKMAFFVGLAAALGSPVDAAILVNQAHIPTTIDFAGFTGAGFSPTPGAGQLDSDDVRAGGFSDGTMNFGDTETSGDFARGSSPGGETVGGVYAMDIPILGSFTGLGVQPTDDDFTPGFIEFVFQNNLGRDVNHFFLDTRLFYLNDEERSSELLVEYSVDGLNYTTIDSMLTPEASDSGGWNRGLIIAEGRFAPILAGGNLYIRYTGLDVSGTGSRDEIAIRNVGITLANLSIPEPSTVPLLGMAVLLVMRLRGNLDWSVWFQRGEAKRPRRRKVVRRRKNYRYRKYS